MWNIVTLVPWDLTPLCTLIVRHQQKPRDGRVGAGKAKRMKISQKELSLRLARYANWVTTRLKTVFAGCHKEKSKLLGYNCIERILVNSKQFTRRLSTIYKFRSFAMAWLYSWMGYYLDAMLFELAG